TSSTAVKVLSLTSGGRVSVLMAVVVSFTGEPPAWAGHGQVQPRLCPVPVIFVRSVRSRRSRHVRFALKADKRTLASICPLSAKRRHMRCSKTAPLFDHLVGAGRQGRRHFDAERTNSSLIDCTTGRSAGFAPLRIRPV